MPLQQGNDQASISANIGELINSGRDPKQAAAIAYRVAGQSRKVGVKKKGEKVGVKK